MRTAIYTCFLFFAFASGIFANGPVTKKLVLVFENRMGKETIALGKTVTTVLGEKITVEKFKYYISHFSVTDNNGATTDLPVQYFLIDENNPESKKITLSIPDIPVSKIRFLLGVDSVKNVSGVQTGSLDPLNGMFWTWNSGYIMAKLEGIAEGLASAGHRFTHDIGGYKTGQNAARTIELSVPESDEIHIIADLNKWFNGKTTVKISDVPVCHSPGNLAMKIADNYATMFSVDTSK